MNKPQSGDFCLWMNADELNMILSALNAYAHNTHYVELVSRLRHQVGQSKFTGPSAPPKPLRSFAS